MQVALVIEEVQVSPCLLDCIVGSVLSFDAPIGIPPRELCPSCEVDGDIESLTLRVECDRLDKPWLLKSDCLLEEVVH